VQNITHIQRPPAHPGYERSFRSDEAVSGHLLQHQVSIGKIKVAIGKETMKLTEEYPPDHCAISEPKPSRRHSTATVHP
jgi:hypothetical protein